MSKKILIAPSILSADFGNLGSDIIAVEKAGADWIHIDAMDGHFVPNITIGPLIVAAIKKDCQLPFDCHLMIENPDKYIPDFIKAGADYVSVHAEACTHLHRTLQLIDSLGAKPAVALNPHTPIEAIKHVIEDCRMVLLMTVNPGFGGQKFINSVLEKTKELRYLIDSKGLDCLIQLDGGVAPDTIGKAAAAGADCFVAGSAIFNKPDYQKAIAELRTNAG